MTDVAALGFTVDSDGIVRGNKALSDLVDAANDAGDASDRFEKDARKGSKGAKELGESAGKASVGISGLAKEALKLAGALGAGLSLAKVASDIVSVNTEFQRLGAMMKVATGSTAAASAEMEKIRKFAAETPYSVQQSTEAFIKLKNLGLDPNIKTMRSFGNTASSMGKDIMQYVEAVADATTGEFERLKEFGIKASQEGDKVSLTFRGVTTEIGKNATEIQKYLTDIGNTQFAGAMTEQMQTLGGQMSNFKDSVDSLYLAMGESFANGALSDALSAASASVVFLTDNLDTIIQVATTAATAFVAYKASLIAVELAQKAVVAINVAAAAGTTTYVGAVVAAYRAEGILLASKAALAGATSGLIAFTKSLTVAMLANPAVWLAGAITGVVMAYQSLSNASREAEQRLQANAEAAQALGIKLSETSQAALAAANENRGVGNSASASEPLIWSFKNATDNLTKSLWEQAKAARAARVEMLKQKLTEAKERESAAQSLTYGGARNNLAASSAALRQGDLLRAGSLFLDAQGARWQQLLSGGRVAQDAARDYNDAARIAIEAKKQLDKALSEPIGKGDLPKAFAVAAGAAGGLAKATGGASKATKDLAKAQKDAAAEEQRKWLIDLDKDARKLAETLGKDLKGSLKQINDELGRTRDFEGAIDDLLSERAAQRIAGVSQSISSNLGLIGGVVGGGAGSILGAILNAETVLDDGTVETLADKIGKHFSSVLDEKGPAFANMFASALAGAGIGAGANSLLGGKGSTLGGALGGALGGIAGEAFKGAATKALTGLVGQSLGKALGAAVPVVGSLIGGALGGLIGGAFKSAKWGRATLTDASGDFAISGNKGSFKDAASQAGGAVVDSLNAIAEQLGGTLGTFEQISVGIRNGDYRVNVGGTSLKKKNGAVDFNGDGQAAIAYAVEQAIKMGAIDGLRASTMTLLQAGGDFQAQLQKAVALDNVYKFVEQQTNPAKFALDQLGKEIAQLTAIANEAGGAAEDLAIIQQYQQIQTQQIMDQQRAQAEAARQEAIDKANDRRSLEVRLLTAQGDVLGALAKSREIELSKIDAANKALLMEVYAAEDLATAKQDLADAYARESSELQATIDKMAQMGGELRKFRDSLFTEQGSGLTYTQALAKLMQTGGLAAAGNETAIGNLQGVSNDFLSVAKSRAGSAIEYQRAIGLVAGYVDKAIGYTDSAGSVAERQLEEMKTQVGALIDINESVLSVADAIEAIGALGESTATITDSQQNRDRQQQERLQAQVERLEQRMAEMVEGSNKQLRAQERLNRLIEQLSPDGLSLQTVPAS